MNEFQKEGECVYLVLMTKTADRELNKLPADIRHKIESSILGLKTWQGNIIKLSGTKNEYRLREGKYRVLFILENGTLYIAGIDDRKDVYRKRG
ncbi:type II toxin-antitoxin system RelE family toxin [Desulfitobacterium hafniense]|uniref:type II toxin-antitoxin system RelE family toxin n=1 Tax=Desulfitobacterium hafniense TaxID=49338 RepID=UPI001FA80B32|nr:hypothetical protein [Desulfitobacterium hafniense]